MSADATIHQYATKIEKLTIFENMSSFNPLSILNLIFMLIQGRSFYMKFLNMSILIRIYQELSREIISRTLGSCE